MNVCGRRARAMSVFLSKGTGPLRSLDGTGLSAKPKSRCCVVLLREVDSPCLFHHICFDEGLVSSVDYNAVSCHPVGGLQHFSFIDEGAQIPLDLKQTTRIVRAAYHDRTPQTISFSG